MSILLSSLVALASAPFACPVASMDCTVEQVESHIRATPKALAQKDTMCLYKTDVQCDVIASGELRGGQDGPRVMWQKVALTGPMGMGEMVMLFDVDEEAVIFIGQGQSSWKMGSPELYDHDEGKVLMHVPGTRGGTGSGNADILFEYDNGNWEPVDIESWRDDLDDYLPEGFGIWKGVRYDFDEMFAFSKVWRDDDGNCCATGGDAFIDFTIADGRLSINALTFKESEPTDGDSAMAGPSQPSLKQEDASARLACPIEAAVYTNPVEPIWEVSFRKPQFAPTAASDLLMMVTGSAFVRDFAFTQSQGFGGSYLLVADDDAEAGQPMPTEEQPEDALAFHAFERGDAGGLIRLADAPLAGEGAPVALYLPDLSKYFWYDDHYVDIETGETLPDRVDMPQAIFIGACADSD